jgi:hypothetical protein
MKYNKKMGIKEYENKADNYMFGALGGYLSKWTALGVGALTLLTGGMAGLAGACYGLGAWYAGSELVQRTCTYKMSDCEERASDIRFRERLDAEERAGTEELTRYREKLARDRARNKELIRYAEELAREKAKIRREKARKRGQKSRVSLEDIIRYGGN